MHPPSAKPRPELSSRRGDGHRFALPAGKTDGCTLGDAITQGAVRSFNAQSAPLELSDSPCPQPRGGPPPHSNLVSVQVPIGSLCATARPAWVGGSALTSNVAMERLAALIDSGDTDDEDALDAALGDAPLIGAQLSDLRSVLRLAAE